MKDQTIDWHDAETDPPKKSGEYHVVSVNGNIGRAFYVSTLGGEKNWLPDWIKIKMWAKL